MAYLDSPTITFTADVQPDVNAVNTAVRYRSNAPRHGQQLTLWQLLPWALFALSPVTADAQPLEEVVVTAWKREQPLDKAPLSLAVLSGTRLHAWAIDDLEAITALQPGLDISRNSNATKVYLRGIGSQGNAGMDQAVSTWIDDVYHGRSRQLMAMLADVERIEVAKGPQSAHLGMNASAGAIAIQTRRAHPGVNEGYIDVTAGERAHHRVNAAWNLPLGESFAVRAVASLTELDGDWDMVDPVTGNKTGNGGGLQARLGRVSARWQPGPGLTIDLKSELQTGDRVNPFAWQPGGCGNLYGLGLGNQAELDVYWQSVDGAGANPFAVPATCSASFTDNRIDHRSPSRTGNRSSYDATEHAARAAWGGGKVRLVLNLGQFETRYLNSGNDLAHGTAVSRRLWISDDSDQASAELRIESIADDQSQWLAGLYWHDGNARFGSGDADGRNRNNPQFIHTLAHQTEVVESVFGTRSIGLAPAWTLSAGLRWTRTTKRFSGVDERIRANTVAAPQRTAFRTQVLDDLSANPAAYHEFGRRERARFEDASRREEEWMPSLNLQWAFTDTTLAYYAWQRGGKAGGFNFRLNGLDATTLEFDAKSVSAHELGIRGLAAQGRLRFGIAAFVSDYRDLQQNTNRGDDGLISAAVIRNVAAASSNGLEFEVAWQPSDRWRLDWSGTLLDARFDDYAGADCTRLQATVAATNIAALFGAMQENGRCAQDLGGARTAHAPRWSSRLGVGYETPAWFGTTLATTLEWFHSADYFTSPHADPLRSQQAFDKFNLRLQLAGASLRWEVALVVTNLTDELTARQLGQDGDAGVSALLDAPRRAFAELRVRF